MEQAPSDVRTSYVLTEHMLLMSAAVAGSTVGLRGEVDAASVGSGDPSDRDVVEVAAERRGCEGQDLSPLDGSAPLEDPPPSLDTSAGSGR